MRIPMSCSECPRDEINAERRADEAARARGETPPPRSMLRPMKPDDWYLADIEQDNAYVGTCRNGHEMRMTLQSVQYELLFESGMIATLVGFHREAVSSIAAALERFYEFAIEVFTFRARLYGDERGAAWKHVAKSSERQFGAFLFLYVVNLGKPFRTGKEIGTYEDWFRFRNDVIHQGRFPSQKDVLEFARYVYELVVATRSALQTLDNTAFQEIEASHYHRGHMATETKAGGLKPGKDGLYRSATSSVLPMMLSSWAEGEEAEFDTRLALTKGNLWLWGFGAPPGAKANR